MADKIENDDLIQKARAEAKKEFAQLAADLEKEASMKAVAGERARIRAILNDDEAEGRTDLAMALALDMDVAPEAAHILLESAPKAVVRATGGTEFDKAMGSLPSAEVGPDDEDVSLSVPQINTAQIYEDRRKAMGQ